MTTDRQDIYQRVTASIIASLEQGVRPWMKPWGDQHAEGRIALPQRHNFETYRGINVLMLWGEAMAKGYASPVWMTFKQALELGANVRKGEKGSPVVYASRLHRTEVDEAKSEDRDREIHYLKSYTVFNVEQIDGLPVRYRMGVMPRLDPVHRIEQADQFIAATKADIRHGGNRAYYARASDHVQMPIFEAFRDAESYYATITHELTHWTMHQSRLDRDLGRKRWGDEGYAMEELVAELGAAFLCAKLDLTPEVRDDHAGYIDHWLKVLKGDSRAIFAAAAHAQRAVDYIETAATPSVMSA